MAVSCLVFALHLIPYELHAGASESSYRVYKCGGGDLLHAEPLQLAVPDQVLPGALQGPLDATEGSPGSYEACAEESTEASFTADHWLRLIVDGVFMVVLVVALLFGQLGAPWGRRPEPASGWDKNNWEYHIWDPISGIFMDFHRFSLMFRGGSWPAAV